MEKIKIDKKNIYNILIFLGLFITILILHINTRVFNDDIDVFGTVLSSGENIFSWLGYRWNTWTSRLVLEFLEVIFDSININFWRIVDSSIYVLLAFSISKIFNKDNDIKMNAIICLSVLLVPFTILYSAGWVSTTIVYLWTFTFGLFSFIPIANTINNKKTSLIYYILSFISLLVALNQEQVCCLVLGFSIISLIILKKDNKKITYPVVVILMSLISLGIIAFCPGNALRNATEMAKYYPEYASFGLKEKLYLAIIPTVNSILINKYLIVLLLISLTIMSYKNGHNKLIKASSLITTVVIAMLTLFKSFTISLFEYIDLFLSIFSRTEALSVSFRPSNLYLFLPICFSILLILMITYLVFCLFKNKKNYLLYPLIFLAGLASRFIMGFSPTVFASNERTSFYMFIIIIIMNVLVIRETKYKKNDINYSFIVMIILAIFNFLNFVNNLFFIGI